MTDVTTQREAPLPKIMPILLCFVVYGLFSTWIYRRTKHPMVGALAASIAIAWGIAVTFPLVGR